MTIFETASFHIVKPCNMACKFCYATFDDMPRIPQIKIEDVRQILQMLYDAGVRKMTFAGGEPMLYNNLTEAIRAAKEIGYTTSIITNGSMLTQQWLIDHKRILDWIGVSIDSMSPLTNYKIGRIHNREDVNYFQLLLLIKHLGYKVKINTVVNRFNETENLHDIIDLINPDRWKIFDTLRVEGQNDRQFEEIKSSSGAFEKFIARHSHPSMVVENNEAMTGSYLLIDPQGRLFENNSGKHTYSKPLHTSTVKECLSEINLNREAFIQRGGIYNW